MEFYERIMDRFQALSEVKKESCSQQGKGLIIT